MRTIIAGSRHINSFALTESVVRKSGFNITYVVCGGCRGVDLSGKMWADHNNVPVIRFDPDWIRYGKAAGPVRNIEMADNVEALILIWDGQSRGSKHMLKVAKERNLRIFEHVVPAVSELPAVDYKSETHDLWGHELPEEAKQNYLI